MILAAALAGLLLVLLAAKAHGRQVRLERESAGLGGEVDFRDPPPRVALLWRRDRIRYWITLPALALALPALGALARLAWPQLLLLALVAAPTLAFALLGLDSARRVAQPRATWAWWGALALATGAWTTLLVL
ncbi:MAG: hypothetical protein QOE90_1572 [Thermoplasmata archaeon]|jgi:hypothetical protein|nr:hypothetical protein [Thermoplasmata archaeon]